MPKSTLIKAASAAALTASIAGTMFAPAANAALPQRNMGTANPTTIGASCTNPGDRGQTIKIKRTYFDGSAGTWTVSNYNDEPLPITRSVTETKTKTWNVSAGIEFPILELIKVTFSTSYTDSSTYEVGETIGPYNLAPGKTAVLRAGWVVSDFEGERTVCGTNHTWQGTGSTFTASLPRERHVAISTRDNENFG